MNAFVFLDIDGVLNAHEFDHDAQSNLVDRDKVARLNRILRETEAKIVLSSAWRYLIYAGAMTLYGMDYLLRTHGVIAGRLVGVTGPDETTGSNERGGQITRWIVGEGWDLYGETGRHVVIDDRDLGVSAAGHPLVMTDGKTGLTDADVDKAIRILKGDDAS